jgi:hypothetical protein
LFAVNATPNPESLAPLIREALGRPSAQMLIERAVEHAVASAADVTAVPDDFGPLLRAGGVVATCDIDRLPGETRGLPTEGVIEA